VLGRRAGEVDRDLVTGDGHPRAYFELALQGLEHVRRLVDAVRHRCEPGPDAALRVRVELVHCRLDPIPPVLSAELGHPAPGEALGSQLGP
jgi:hypothetical protein